MNEQHSSCKPDSETSVIADALNAIGPRRVEGDQGAYTSHSVHDAIAAIEFQRKVKLNSKAKLTAALRTISGIRLWAHDGRGS